MDIYERIFEFTPDAMLVTDSAGRIVKANAQAVQMFGHARDELQGSAIELLIPGRLAARHAAHREHYLLSPHLRPMGAGMKLSGRRKDGSEFPVDIMLGTLDTDDGMLVLCVVRDMTDRHLAEEARSSLAAIVDSATDAIIGKDLDGTIRNWNPAAERLFGYTAGDIVGRNIDVLIPAERLDEETRILDRIRTGERYEPYETVRRRRDGSLVEVWIAPSPIKDAKGRVIGASKIARDITERKQAEHALRESEERFRTLVEHASDGIFISDASSRYLDVNAAGAEMMRCTREEVLSLSIPDLLAEEERTRLAPEIERLRNGKSAKSTWRFKRRDGTYFFGEVNVRQLPDTRMLAFLRDVTERMRTDQALRDSESRLSGIIESSLDAIITIDTSQHVRVFNRAAEQMFQVSAADVIGGTLQRFVPAALWATHVAGVAAMTQGRRPDRLPGHERVLVGVRSNGEEFPMEASISCAGEGDRTLMTVRLRDVTGLREAQLAQARQQAAEAASRAKTEFLSRMSHELRTPLNAVLGFSQLLLKQSNDNLQARQLAEIGHIHQAGLHLSSLIDDLLDVSRIELGALHVELAEVDLLAVLDEALLMVRSQAEAGRIALRVQVDRTLPVRVRADTIRLRQVLINLLTNALKYNRSEGHVRIGMRLSKASARLDVCDTGIGMTQAQVDGLFVPFNRVGRETSGVEGTGIGLALTRQLVTLMNGTIEVRSTPGQGTTVSVELPMAAASSPCLPCAQGRRGGEVGTARDDPAAGPCAPTGLLLYIEDDDINALVLEEMLATADWPSLRIARARDGRSGLDLALRLQPDLVLMDMRLPDIGGLALLHRLRADPAGRHLRVVALSASALPDEIEQVRRAGAWDYWTKPLDLRGLLANLRRALAADLRDSPAPA